VEGCSYGDMSPCDQLSIALS